MKKYLIRITILCLVLGWFQPPYFAGESIFEDWGVRFYPLCGVEEIHFYKSRSYKGQKGWRYNLFLRGKGWHSLNHAQGYGK